MNELNQVLPYSMHFSNLPISALAFTGSYAYHYPLSPIRSLLFFLVGGYGSGTICGSEWHHSANVMPSEVAKP